jgi:hypothetical protein
MDCGCGCLCPSELERERESLVCVCFVCSGRRAAARVIVVYRGVEPVKETRLSSGRQSHKRKKAQGARAARKPKDQKDKNNEPRKKGAYRTRAHSISFIYQHSLFLSTSPELPRVPHMHYVSSSSSSDCTVYCSVLSPPLPPPSPIPPTTLHSTHTPTLAIPSSYSPIASKMMRRLRMTSVSSVMKTARLLVKSTWKMRSDETCFLNLLQVGVVLAGDFGVRFGVESGGGNGATKGGKGGK